MNPLSNLFSGIKGDVAVNITVDPGSAVLLAVLIIMAIVLSHLVIKVIG